MVGLGVDSTATTLPRPSDACCTSIPFSRLVMERLSLLPRAPHTPPPRTPSVLRSSWTNGASRGGSAVSLTAAWGTGEARRPIMYSHARGRALAGCLACVDAASKVRRGVVTRP